MTYCGIHWLKVAVKKSNTGIHFLTFGYHVVLNRIYYCSHEFVGVGY